MMSASGSGTKGAAISLHLGGFPDPFPDPPFLAVLDFLALLLLRFALLVGGLLAFFSKDYGGTLPNKQGKSQRPKARKSKKARKGESGSLTTHTPLIKGVEVHRLN